MKKKILSAAVSAAIMGFIAPQAVLAQEEEQTTQSNGGIQEIIAVGRLQNSADQVMVERQENEVVADYIDITMISRIGDTNVASALRRVPGVTLVDDKYVFVRGLGERYSSSLLNGAHIPSPDLTRNVIPLDIFPTSIVQSIEVQKGYAADMPASFSGGQIDIRTTSIPDDLEYSLEIGSLYNSSTSGNVLSYSGGDDDWLGTDDGTRALSPVLEQALVAYNGSLSPQSILAVENAGASGVLTSFAGAQAINRDLALALFRDIDVRQESPDFNYNLDASAGNSFYFDNGMELGFITAASYSNTTMETDRVDFRSVGDPENVFAESEESVHNVNITGNLGLGWRWFDEHSLETTSLLLRNTDDEVSIKNEYNANRLFSNGLGFQDVSVRYEEREMVVNQIRGSHTMGSTFRDVTGFNAMDWLDGFTFDWYYSDATSTTDIPNEIAVAYDTTVDPATGNVLSRRLENQSSAADIRFTNLDDEVESYGWNAMQPIFLANTDIELSGGWSYARKARDYRQIQFRLGTPDPAVTSGFTGTPGEIFTDANIQDPANSFAMDINANNGESYLAAVNNTAAYGQTDITWDQTWRLVGGVRWEDYQQLGIPWNPIQFEGCQISCEPDVILDSIFTDDDYYPSLALTYMRPNFWAETFQLRLGYSETLVRPDLREITPSSYIDPITDNIVSGSEDVVPATVKNYDLRGEWFFSNGDNFTASLFRKDLTNPIEFFEQPGSSDLGRKATGIVNAESGEVYGLELEFLKELSFLGDSFDSFFVNGNMAILDSELVAGSAANAPTNPVRPLAGASDAVNLQLGWDSDSGAHSAMVVYNVFSERLYFAGRNGSPDAYEQPFHSLDFSYFWYPTDNWVLKLRAQNILDEAVEVERNNVVTFSEEPGTTLRLDVRWRY